MTKTYHVVSGLYDGSDLGVKVKHTSNHATVSEAMARWTMNNAHGFNEIEEREGGRVIAVYSRSGWRDAVFTDGFRPAKTGFEQNRSLRALAREVAHATRANAVLLDHDEEDDVEPQSDSSDEDDDSLPFSGKVSPAFHPSDPHFDDPRYNPRRVGKRNSRKTKTLQCRRAGHTERRDRDRRQSEWASSPTT